MLVQIITENGQKKVIPLTADAGAGNPVGSLISMYKKSSPSGYLYCDGSTFDQTEYPLLYAYLGSNVLPDYREFALVGAEQNTTDTIASHDVYTQGEFKDDQVQNISGSVNVLGYADQAGENGALKTVSASQNTNANSGSAIYLDKYTLSIDASKSARAGTVTRGKRKAVYFYIKATSGLSENAQDNVVAQLNEERSYSTEEVNTGKKWIDGKPTYEITKLGNATFTNSAWTSIAFFDDNVSKHIVNVTGIIFNTNIRVNGADKDFTNVVRFAISDTTTITTDYQITLEYTKTT